MTAGTGRRPSPAFGDSARACPGRPAPRHSRFSRHVDSDRRSPGAASHVAEVIGCRERRKKNRKGWRRTANWTRWLHGRIRRGKGGRVRNRIRAPSFVRSAVRNLAYGAVSARTRCVRNLELGFAVRAPLVFVDGAVTVFRTYHPRVRPGRGTRSAVSYVDPGGHGTAEQPASPQFRAFHAGPRPATPMGPGGGFAPPESTRSPEKSEGGRPRYSTAWGAGAKHI